MPIAWFNGRLIKGSIPLDPSDRGLTLGDGLFETVAIFNGNPAYLVPHLDRLENGAKVLGIDISRAAIASGVSELIDHFPGQNSILRITVTRGTGARGLAGSASQPTRLITMAPREKGTLNAPVRLATSSIRRNEHSPASRLKTLSYIDNILAAREATNAAAEDALLLNTAGRAACSTISNLFVIRGNEVVTPPISEGVLPGIVRTRLLALARSTELDPAERPLRMAELLSADAVFLTNSIRLIRPVTAIDGTAVSRTANRRLQNLSDVLCEDIARETGADPRSVAEINL